MTELIFRPENKWLPLIYYLSVEEYVARSSDRDMLFLWRVKPTVICGRNQVLAAETDLDFCRTHGIEVFRRKSGGGAVYSDPGNIMVSYIVSSEDVQFTFDRYLQTATLYLRSLGLKAERSGRNDILVNGKKVSGNAFYKAGKRSIIHGTMLFDSDFDMMTKALTPSYSKISSKGISSVRQRVANISEFTSIDVENFMRGLADFFCDSAEMLPAHAESEIEKIMQTYLDEEFYMGHEPVHTLSSEAKIENVGLVTVFCEIKGGKLRNIDFTGDFFPLCGNPGAVLTEKLEGTEFTFAALSEALPDELPGRAIKNLTKKQLLDLFFNKFED